MDSRRGAATFYDFDLKRMGKKPPGFTPRSKKDPATGVFGEAKLVCDSDVECDINGMIIAKYEGAVEVTFTFTGLHLAKKRTRGIGNAHFKLFLNITRMVMGFLKARQVTASTSMWKIRRKITAPASQGHDVLDRSLSM